jgi:uncharacterized protein involved in response to NO
MPVLSLHATPPEATDAPLPAGWPLLRLGFRPFYLGAALFALVAMPLWIALPPGAGDLDPGCACPAVARARDVVRLRHSGHRRRARNRRNLPLAGILMLLSLASGAFHLADIGTTSMAPLAALHAGLALIMMIECVIAGRVVPAFTMSATPGLKLAARPALERATLAMIALALALWVFAPPTTDWGLVSGAALALAAAMHLVRQWHWRPAQTRSRPILWILHAAYAWIAVGLGLLALAQFGRIGASAGVHALAVGATGA